MTTTSCWPGSSTQWETDQRASAKAPETGSASPISTTSSPSIQQRRRVAGDGEPDRLGRVLAQRQGDDAAERGVATGEEGAVERLQRTDGIAGQGGGGAQGVAGDGRQRGGAGAAAGDVADHEHPAVGDPEDVVEIASDLVLGAGGPVHRRDRPAGDVGQRWRQQPALQRLGDLGPRPLGPLEIGEQAAVVECERDPAGEDPGEVGILAAVPAARPADGERQRPGDLAAGVEGDRDRRATLRLRRNSRSSGPSARPARSRSVIRS